MRCHPALRNPLTIELPKLEVLARDAGQPRPQCEVLRPGDDLAGHLVSPELGQARALARLVTAEAHCEVSHLGAVSSEPQMDGVRKHVLLDTVGELQRPLEILGVFPLHVLLLAEIARMHEEASGSEARLTGHRCHR
jgi:hypothetical protein